MCTQTVTLSYTDGKGRSGDAAAQAGEREPTPIPSWPGSAGRRASKRQDKAIQDASTAEDYAYASAAGLYRRLGILDRSLLNLTDGGHRLTTRQRSIVLNDDERANLRHLVNQAAHCGRRWAAFRSFEARESGDYEVRLACQLKCGTRGCPECMAKIRTKEQYRVAGPWNLFFTFTIPRGRASAADAWREVHLWIAALVREIRRETRIATIADDDNNRLRKPFTAARRMLARSHVRASEDIKYAWVIEPHKDGYPHVHMVIEPEWVSFDWLRGIWSQCCGVSDAWVYGEKVYSIDGACRYLCKYISKAQLSIDILAIMFKRRMWATNIDKPEDPEPKWFREETVSSENAWLDAARGDAWLPDVGWELMSAKAGGYAMWERRAAVDEGYVWSTERPLVEYDADMKDMGCGAMARVVWGASGCDQAFEGDVERLEAAVERKWGLTG